MKWFSDETPLFFLCPSSRPFRLAVLRAHEKQVFEFVDTDLYKLIGSPQFLTDEHVKLFLYQMLIGLKYVHSAHVIHRDIKVRLAVTATAVTRDAYVAAVSSAARAAT